MESMSDFIRYRFYVRAPVKGITVREMFNLSGVVLEACDYGRLFDDMETGCREVMDWYMPSVIIGGR